MNVTEKGKSLEEHFGFIAYFNPLPVIDGMAPVMYGGRQYPFNTRGVQVSNGRWWIAEPRGFLRYREAKGMGIPIHPEDECKLIVGKVDEVMVPWGLKRVDWDAAARMGDEAYFAEISAGGLNAFLDTVDERVVRSRERENEGRLQARLKERPPNHVEQVFISLAESMRKKLNRTGDLKAAEQLKAIEAAGEADDAPVDLGDLKLNDLRKKATIMFKDAGVRAPKLITMGKDQILEQVRALQRGELAEDTKPESEESDTAA